MKYFGGIDTGKSGGSAVLDRKGKLVDSMHSEDRKDVIEFLKKWSKKDVFFRVEKNNAMPMQGVVSMFTFGGYCHGVLWCLDTLGIAYEEVRPQYWQKRLLIPPRKKKKVLNKKLKKKTWKFVESPPEFKKRLAKEARKRFPKDDIHDNVADAVLIAEGCRRELK